MTRPRVEVADVIRDHGDAFLEAYGDTLSPEQRRALADLARCRTAALGRARRGVRPVRVPAGRV
jgi:hypothetical protein